jgi:hypothetical protein
MNVGAALRSKHTTMEDLLDTYLLQGRPSKGDVVAALLGTTPVPPVAGPYFEGLRVLRERTPDMALVALRLALAGKPVVDGSVVGLRDLAERARKGDAQAAADYRTALE